jgi:hypothetical protein
MAKQEVSAVQIQMAAAAGVKMLQQDDLMVPLSVSKSGALGVLEGLLQALANGEVVLAQPQPENLGAGGPKPPIAPVETPPQGDQEPSGEEGKAANETGSDPSADA